MPAIFGWDAVQSRIVVLEDVSPHGLLPHGLLPTFGFVGFRVVGLRVAGIRKANQQERAETHP